MAVLTVLVFLSVSLLIAGIAMLVAPGRSTKRLAQITSGEPDKMQWTEAVAKVTGPFAKLSLPSGDWETSPMRLRFLHAGIRHPAARLIYFGCKTLLPVTFALGWFLLLRAVSPVQGMALMFQVLLAALIGCYLPNAVVGWKVRRRKRTIFENFPDASDLMLVCVEAGLGLDAAMAKVADEMRRKSVPMAQELQLTILELRAGASREQALRNLATRTGVDEVMTFATMLNQADKFGTSVADSLRVFSDDLRHKRLVRAEEAAAKIPTKMLFPLVLFIFPSIIMVVLGPAIIQVVRTVMPMLAGAGR